MTESGRRVVSPPRTRRQVILRRVGITLAVVGVVAVAALIAFLVAVNNALHDSHARSEADEARARAQVQIRADAFADDLRRWSVTGIPGDDELADAAYQHDVEVLHVRPGPDFAVTIELSEHWGHLFGSSTVTACFDLSVRDAATPRAKVDVQRLAECPAGDWTPQPTPEPTTS
jgi:hypothetical protein